MFWPMQVMICVYLVFLGVPIICALTYGLAWLVGKFLSFSGGKTDNLLPEMQVPPPFPFWVVSPRPYPPVAPCPHPLGSPGERVCFGAGR